MELLRIFLLLSVIGWLRFTPVAESGGGEGVLFYVCHDRLISYHWILLPMGHSQRIGVSRRCDEQTDLLARLHATCTSVDTTQLRTGHSSFPRGAQASRDMHGGHFEHLPL
ncbi:hypothetical protein TNCV_2376241 [Trichonephila clavipes]|nr:hypothetical protein TNCV_2376241 [Trichonephila clavipes]